MCQLPTLGLRCGLRGLGLGGFHPVPGTNQFVPEPNPSASTRFREGVTGTWWSPMPGGEESDRGAGGGSGGEASGGASQSRSPHSGVDRGSVGRGRAGAGVGGRGLVAGASAAGMEQSPVRPASVGGRLGTPSRSRGAAVAAGGSAVSPADMPTVQRPAARAPVSVSLIPGIGGSVGRGGFGRPRQSPPAPPRPRRGRSWHPQGHPACTNPGGGQSEGRWRLPCTGRPVLGTI